MGKLRITESRILKNNRELMLMSAIKSLIESINTDRYSTPHLSSLNSGIKSYFNEMDSGKKENISLFSEFFELQYLWDQNPYKLRVYHLNIAGDRDRILVEVVMDNTTSAKAAVVEEKEEHNG